MKLGKVREWAAASPWHLRVTAEGLGTESMQTRQVSDISPHVLLGTTLHLCQPASQIACFILFHEFACCPGRPKVNSSINSTTTFGFPGTGGFLMISVPPNAKGNAGQDTNSNLILKDRMCINVTTFGCVATEIAGELVVTDRVAAAKEPTFQYREGPGRLEGDVEALVKTCVIIQYCNR